NTSSVNDEAQAFIIALGGKENIVDTDACITRLRMSVHDSSALKDENFTVLGAKGVIRPDKKSIQIVLGTKAEKVAEEIKHALHKNL
ncbi:MAG: PTS sugar transporter, partial [Sulfurovum sp.]